MVHNLQEEACMDCRMHYISFLIWRQHCQHNHTEQHYCFFRHDKSTISNYYLFLQCILAAVHFPTALFYKQSLQTNAPISHWLYLHRARMEITTCRIKGSHSFDTYFLNKFLVHRVIRNVHSPSTLLHPVIWCKQKNLPALLLDSNCYVSCQM